jgi:hypothetical protein
MDFFEQNLMSKTIIILHCNDNEFFDLINELLEFRISFFKLKNRL